MTDNSNDSIIGWAVSQSYEVITSDGRTHTEVTVSIGGLPCPKCGVEVADYDDHMSGCPNWGMLPEHWLGDGP